MPKLKELMREATEIAERRGHRLVWKHAYDTRGSRSAIGECVKCKTSPNWEAGECSQCADPPVTGWVLVKTRPQPNEVDIGGPAVALDCPFTDEQAQARAAVQALIGCPCGHDKHSFYGCLTGGCDCREDHEHS